MENSLKDIKFQLGWEEKSLIKEYIETIANKGLTRYKSIIQTGKKEGESLYTHVLNGIFVFERLRPILEVTETEAQVIMTVYSVHDLNKLPRFAQQRSYNAIGTQAHVEEELENLGLTAFFPEYAAYLSDITTLARAHSGHYHTDGELLIKSHDPYKLGKKRIEELRHVIRAMDVIDLSHSLQERAHKQTFLSELNTFLSMQTPVRQYEFQSHTILENRGILTNIIHNAASSYLEQEFGLIPLLLYPDGVAYLAEKGQNLEFDTSNSKAIGKAVQASIDKMVKAKFATEFINSRIAGIQVDAKFRELGVTFEEIFTEIYNKVAGRTYQKRLNDMTDKARKRAVKAANKNVAKLKDEEDKQAIQQQATDIESMADIMPESDETMRVGELLRSYYIFLTDHYKKAVPNIWDYLYDLLKIPQERRAFYNAFDQRYDRPYVIAKDLPLSLDEMQVRILEAGNSLAGKSQQDLQMEEETPITQYVQKFLTVSFATTQASQFAQGLKDYVSRQHTQCCYCSSGFGTTKWMAADVPSDIKVQYFSNRLRGGQGEPKRHICDICSLHFMLHKLNYPNVSPGGVGKQGVKTYYLHLFPYSFHSDIFLNAIRTEINRFRRMNVESLYMLTERAIREFMKEQRVEPRFSQTKRNGFPLPKFSEIQGNQLIFPVNCMGQNESERFLFAVENALLMQRYLGCKVVLTDASISLLEQTEFDDLYIDSIPATFSGLLPANNLGKDDVETVWKRITTLYKIKGQVYSDGDELLVLLRALSEEPFSLYYVCERLILKRLRKAKSTENEWQEIHITKHVSALIGTLIERGETMEQLKQLAAIAWEGKIKGDSLKKNALMMPFDMAFDKLQHKGEMIDLETVQAALTEDIFAYLDRIAKNYKPGATKREKIKAFVDTFFSGLLQGVYHNNVNKLLADEKILKSAFLFYIREQIPTKKAEGV
jgi:CRISPR-associated protein Csc3